MIRRALASGALLALVVNLLLAATRLWSAGGQTTTVQIEAIGGSYRVFVDGSQMIPKPGPAAPDRAKLDAPARGAIALGLLAGVPSLPEPQGIDSVVVTDPAGREIFRDDFYFLEEERWQVVSGAFQVQDGVLVAREKGVANVLQLRGPGWSDYVVTVTYRNAMAGGLEARRQGAGRVAYGFNLIRDFPNYLEAFDESGEWTGTEFGGFLHTRKPEILRSLGAMAVGAYPLPLLGVATGAVAALALALALLQAVLSRWLRLPAFGPVSALASKLRPYAWPALVVVAAIVAFGGTLHIISEYYDRVPHLPDEDSYVFQAKLFAAGQITGAVPPVREAFYFWLPNFLYENGDRWSSVYPFGHPLILAPGALLGVTWLVPPLVGAGCVGLIYLVGRRLYDARTGAVAAVLLIASPFFLMQASNFMSHNTWTLYVLLSLLFLLQRERPLLYGALSGLFFGLALNTRTVETAMLIPPFAAVLGGYLAPKEGRGTALRYLGAFLAGGGLMALAMLGYNAAATGDPLTAPYTRDTGADNVLGFDSEFTLDVGLRNVQALLMSLLLVFNAWPAWVGLAFVLLPFVLGTRNRWDYFCLASVLLVAGVYVLYRWSGLYEGPRYWYQAVPFLILLTARGAECAARLIGDAAAQVRGRLLRDLRPARWAGLLVVYAFVAYLVVAGTGGWLFGWNKTWLEADVPQVQAELADVRDFFDIDDRLVKLGRELDLENALVLVQPCGFFQSLACYGTVFLENSVAFDGDVVWARYITGRNAEIVAAFPGRAVYVADWEGGPSIAPYNPAEDP